MIDRAKLEEALAEYRRRMEKAPAGYFAPHLIEQSNLIVAAAEAHLATLPGRERTDGPNHNGYTGLGVDRRAMTDREKLQEALCWLIDRSKPSAECVQFVPILEQAIRAHLATLPEEPAVWAIVGFDGEPNIASGSRLLTVSQAKAKIRELRAGFPLKVFALVDLPA